MKKIICIIMTLMWAVIRVSAYDGPTGDEIITLSHQGQESYFGYNELQKAIDKAVDGDTVYFSAGYFDIDVTLTKKLSFIGVGADAKAGTYFYGKIRVQLPDNTRLTSCLLDGIYLTNNRQNGETQVDFLTPIENVIIKRCYVETYLGEAQYFTIKSLLYDRCRLDAIALGYMKHKIVCQNCNIQGKLGYKSTENDFTFNNCTINIDQWNDYYLCGNFNNCIITTYKESKIEVASDAKFTNCLYEKRPEQAGLFETASLVNCYPYEPGQYPHDFTKEELGQLGYLGTDGTVVGCEGGSTPLTLVPLSVKTSQKVHIEQETQQAQISINVSSHN